MKKLAIYRQLLCKIGLWMLRKTEFLPGVAAKLPVESETAEKIEKWKLERGWAEECNMHEAAARIGISKDELSLYFRHTFKKSFLQWRKEMRISEAKRLLLEDYSVSATAVGEAVGISDKSNFRHQFRELTGLTPAQWRLKHKPHV